MSSWHKILLGIIGSRWEQGFHWQCWNTKQPNKDFSVAYSDTGIPGNQLPKGPCYKPYRTPAYWDVLGKTGVLLYSEKKNKQTDINCVTPYQTTQFRTIQLNVCWHENDANFMPAHNQIYSLFGFYLFEKGINVFILIRLCKMVRKTNIRTYLWLFP